MNEIFFFDCLMPVLEDKAIAPSNLRQVSEEEAKFINSYSTGRAWVVPFGHISLAEITSRNGKYYGCAVQWESISAGGREIDSFQVIEFFGELLKEQVQDGNFIEIKRCGDVDTDLNWVFESRFTESHPVRVVLSYQREIDFLLLMAAENDEVSEPETC